MNTFALTLYDSLRNERFDAVSRFLGADDSGAFGVWPHHAEMVAVLRYGLARFEDAAGTWHYLALPGGVLRFADNALTLVSERYFIGDDRDRIADRLAQEMAREDSELHAVRATLGGIERTLMRRLSEMRRHAADVIER
jgi:F-type H+-transporting ATPase subunit epsilon